MPTTRHQTPAQAAAWRNLDRLDQSSVTDIDQHWPISRHELAQGLDLAAAAAAVLDRPCWITAGTPVPGKRTVWNVTDYETAHALARVMPDGLITTNPDGRPEYLPASAPWFAEALAAQA